MSLMTYQDARPWAAAIKRAVVSRAMPPWFAADGVVRFKNDPRLRDDEIETIVKWVDGGAQSVGESSVQALAPSQGVWSIGEPDTVFVSDRVDVPPDGVVAYQYLRIAIGVPSDKWIQGLEIRAENQTVVHHVIATANKLGDVRHLRQAFNSGIQLGGYAAGGSGILYQPGVARLLPAGADIFLQVHYTPDGQRRTDRLFVAVKWARERPLAQALSVGVINNTFVIPPHTQNYAVSASRTLPTDVEVIALMPHMHLRGRSMRYTAYLPGGQAITILDVPNFEFGWQLTYELERPLRLPSGTRLEVLAHFDNSAGNRRNPDPKSSVRWGEQSWEEMMVGWLTVTKRVQVPALTKMLEFFGVK